MRICIQNDITKETKPSCLTTMATSTCRLFCNLVIDIKEVDRHRLKLKLLEISIVNVSPYKQRYSYTKRAILSMPVSWLAMLSHCILLQIKSGTVLVYFCTL